MRKIIAILITAVLVSCTKTLSVSELFNALHSTEKNDLLDSKLSDMIQISDSRTLVYSYNTQCSECVNKFIMFLRNVDDYRFDSLLIVAHEAYDFIQSDYIIQKAGVSLPDATRIIYDPNNDIFKKLFAIVGDVNLMLIEDKRVLAKCNTLLFTFDELLGFCVKDKLVKKR